MKPKKKTASKKPVAVRSGEPPQARQNPGARTGPAAARGAESTVVQPKAKAARPGGHCAASGQPLLHVPPILLEGDEPAAPIGGGPGERYDLGPASPPEHMETLGELGELPEAYGTEKLLLTARDPNWLYAHWDLTREQ